MCAVKHDSQPIQDNIYLVYSLPLPHRSCGRQSWFANVCECYQSLTAHQHQKGHTVPKQVITVATSIQVTTV